MKSDFMLAITQLSAEKNLPKDVVLAAGGAALGSAYKKSSLFSPNQNISVKINPQTGRVEVWVEKKVVARVTDPHVEISLREARTFKKDAEIGETIMVEATPEGAGRIAAQTAKQVILQRLHEAEHSAIFEEFADKEGEVVSGVVQRFEAGNVLIDMGRTEAVLPPSEQVRTERYRVGQRLKVLLLQVARTNKGPRVIVSRSHPDLLRRLFEMEVPEVYNGTVEIKSIAREAGSRSKVAVAAKQEGVDPVGCCVGLRGIRIQNIVNEINGEKIDVVMWHPNPATFIANALSPAHILSVELNEKDQSATVIVPDKQLSLAIGREGQNARLAAKLTGWRIDIKSASAAEAEKVAVAAAGEEKAAPETAAEEPAVLASAGEGPVAEAELPVETVEAGPIGGEVAPEEPAVAEEGEGVVAEEAEVAGEAGEEILAPPVILETADTAGGQLRFAEDILGTRYGRGDSGQHSKKKKKKGAYARDGGEESSKAKKGRRDFDIDEDIFEE
ncbi:MAG: transcription termination factor NusA [Dehalococcoidales bacterium]|nr:transcription termination factor NusA [Dehalococcoidales bacterium]